MSANELRYLNDLASLDRIGLGMLDPSNEVNDPRETRDRLAAKGLVRVLPEPTPYGEPVVELTTKGLRTLQRVTRIVARL